MLLAEQEPDLDAATIAVKRRLWLACVWSWPVAIVCFGLPFVFGARFIPPPHPSWSAARLASYFADNLTGIRIGVLCAMFASALLLLFYAVVSSEIRKIEGRPGLLATIQWGGAIMLVFVFQLICLVWITASYRQDVDPGITRTLNDFCWFVWSTFIPTYSIQYVCMAVAGFMDRREQPLWPRWSAYMNLWVAVTGAGGVLAVFFKSGPFAWNGVVGFWIPVIVFAAGMSVNTWLILRRGKYEESIGLPLGHIEGARS